MQTKSKSKAMIQNLMLINNSAPSLDISGASNIMLTRIKLVATAATSVGHIRLKGEKIFIYKVPATVTYPEVPRSNMIKEVLTMTSHSGKIGETDLHIKCSENFYVDVRSEKPSVVNDTKMQITATCSTCGPNKEM